MIIISIEKERNPVKEKSVQGLTISVVNHQRYFPLEKLIRVHLNLRMRKEFFLGDGNGMAGGEGIPALAKAPRGLHHFGLVITFEDPSPREGSGLRLAPFAT